MMWIGTIILVSTALLTVGWWFLSLAARGREPRNLTSSVSKVRRKNRILGKFGSNPNSIHHRSNLVHKGHKHSIHMA